MEPTLRWPTILEWGWAGSALELESGDLHVVVPSPQGALVALMDGLGHGPEAAAAAQAAIPLLESDAGHPVADLVLRCHEGLRKTRGVAMSLASFDARDGSMTWTGVGNVDGVLLRPSKPARAILLRGGVVGYKLPALHVETIAVSRGGLLIMVTDGIRGGFTEHLSIAGAPMEIAESILLRFAKRSDDAHVVVARYWGLEP
jgi:phosphoserine phosphatase RsbX